MKNILKVLVWLIVMMACLCLILMLIIRIASPGKLNRIKDADGKIIEGSFVEKNQQVIGNIPQRFFLRGENPNNPVILFLHGGPGSPEFPMIEAMESDERLERYFTVCYWDQRGAGMTFSKDNNAADMTVDQFIEDTRQMTEYLINRFGQQKIILMGHSWGAFLGAKTVYKYPDYYQAFIGVGQVVNQRLSEQLAHKYMLAHAKEIGDKKAERVLAKIDPNAADFPTNSYLFSARGKYMNKYGIGISHGSISMYDLVKNILMFKGYTFSEKINYIRGTKYSIDHLFDDVLKDNLFESTHSFSVPVYILQGKYDYQTSYALAKEWVDRIDAPDKKLITFEKSAHSPNMDEQERFVNKVNEIIGDIDNLSSRIVLNYE